MVYNLICHVAFINTSEILNFEGKEGFCAYQNADSHIGDSKKEQFSFLEQVLILLNVHCPMSIQVVMYNFSLLCYYHISFLI